MAIAIPTEEYMSINVQFILTLMKFHQYKEFITIEFDRPYRYQAALHPFQNYCTVAIVQNPCFIFQIVIFSSIYIQYTILSIYGNPFVVK